MSLITKALIQTLNTQERAEFRRRNKAGDAKGSYSISGLAPKQVQQGASVVRMSLYEEHSKPILDVFHTTNLVKSKPTLVDDDDIIRMTTLVNQLSSRNMYDRNNTDCKAGCTGLCFGCTGTCTGGCTSCSGTCTGSCLDTCTGTCTGGCRSSCSASCTGGCEGTCKGSCKDGCTGTCKDSCNNLCTEGCLGCTSQCIGYCTDNCRGGAWNGTGAWWACTGCTNSCGTTCSFTCSAYCHGHCQGMCCTDCSSNCGMQVTVMSSQQLTKCINAGYLKSPW